MAPALSILWILATLLVLWGCSLMWRGMWPRTGAGRRCPACRAPVTGLACGECGFEGESARDFRSPRAWRMVVCGWIPVAGGIGAAYCAEVVRGWFRLEGGGVAGLEPMQGVAVGLGLFGIVLGGWSWRGDRSRGRRRCPGCWYDMSASKLVCPECGHDAQKVKRLYRARRRWRGVVGAAVLVPASYGVWVIPAVRLGGPVAAVPTWVLIAGLPWWPDVLTIEDSGNYTEDWTLQGRSLESKLWGVERWLLRARARRIAASEPGPWALSRAVAFLDEEEDADLARAVHMAVLRGLVSADGSTRERALDCDVMFPIDALSAADVRPLLGRLLGVLRDGTTSERSAAASYLSPLGDEAGGAVPMLMQGVREAGWKRNILLAIPLMRLAQTSLIARAMVLEASRDEDPWVRYACAYAMQWPIGDDDEVVDRLLEMLGDSQERVVQMAARSLCRGAARPDAVIPALLDAAERSEEGLDLWELHRFGVRLQPYMPRLAALLDSPCHRRQALWALEALVWEPARPDFGAALGRLHTIALGADAEEADRAVWILQTLVGDGVWVPR